MISLKSEIIFAEKDIFLRLPEVGETFFQENKQRLSMRAKKGRTASV
jgi:hypothetical protein